MSPDPRYRISLLLAALLVAAGTGPRSAPLSALSPNGEQQDRTSPPSYVFEERIHVALRTVAVRVVDDSGSPILGLTAEDFTVLHGRSQLPVLAAEWIAAGAVSEPGTGIREESSASPLLTPRLIVFWVQTDLHAVRIRGLLRIQPFAQRILDSLPPEDLVAVVSFDSRLKLWQDLTSDRAAPAQAIADATRFGKSPVLRRSRYPSLARHFDFRAARAAAKPEVALRLTAEALRPLPGEKIIIYLGWGLGRYGSGGFSMTGEYARARRALHASRTSVFVLDITDADAHTLELGLREVAEDTGGTYEKTHRFTAQAADKLIRAISGYYLLTVDASQLPAPLDGVDIRLPGRKARILARSPLPVHPQATGKGPDP